MYTGSTLLIAAAVVFAGNAITVPATAFAPSIVSLAIGAAIQPDGLGVILVQNRRNAGGGQRGAAGGGRGGNFNSNNFHRDVSSSRNTNVNASRNVNVNANRNVNVNRGCCNGNYDAGPNWGGVAAGVAVGTVVGAAVNSAAQSNAYAAPPPTYPPGYVTAPP